MYALINCASSKSQLGVRALQKARQHVCEVIVMHITDRIVK